jgi:hypothetical protein
MSEPLQAWRERAVEIPGEVCFADYKHQIRLGARARRLGLPFTGEIEAATVAGFLALWLLEESRNPLRRDWCWERALKTRDTAETMAMGFARAAHGCSARWGRFVAEIRAAVHHRALNLRGAR